MKSFGVLSIAIIAGAVAFGQQPTQIQSQKTVAIAHAKQVAVATLMYAQDYNEIFPIAKSQTAFVTATFPYLKTKEPYADSNPNKGAILFNFKLAGKKMASINDPARAVLVYSENAWPDGGRVVGWADGHVKFVDATAWAKVASQVPAAKKKK